MKKMIKGLGIAVFAAMLVFAMTGCKEEPEPDPPPPPADTTNGGVKTLSGNITIRPSTNVTTGMELTATYSGSEAVSYQWKKGETGVGTNSNKYTPSEAGSYTVTVSATGYNSKTSEAVTVTGASLPPLTGTVSISGIAVVGQTLTAVTTYLNGSGNISYQWKRGDTVIGTNSATYTIQSSDVVDSIITVTVTRSGNSGSVISAPTVVFFADTSSTPGLEFKLINNGASYSVSKGTANAAQVVIPVLYQEKFVTAIEFDGFNGYTNMTRVTIPNSVTSIGNYAFYNCAGLTSITIPNSVTSIGQGAFFGCSGLTSITMPFTGAALNGTSNTHFGYIFGATSSSGQNSSIPASLKTVEITGNSITASAFSGCTGLTSVTIGNSVTEIGECAFYNCTGLTSVTIGNSVTKIGKGAFFNCTGLTGSLTIPNSVTTILDSAFAGCTGLTSVTIPNSVNNMASTYGNSYYQGGAFANCTGLTSVTFSNGLTFIGGFYGCTGLTSITIPNSVTRIDQYAFDGCTGLTSVTIPNSVTYIDSGAFSGCGLTGSLTIPNSVTFINRLAFAGCTGLTSVTIPNSVTSIGGVRRLYRLDERNDPQQRDKHWRLCVLQMLKLDKRNICDRKQH